MTYEEYLDEVTTLIYELFEVDEQTAIRWVMAAQDNDFFVAHDEQPALRTAEQAEVDARQIVAQRKAK
ncbi:MAG: hypothetical protein ACRCV6_07320 [Formosimonas sp.]